MIWGEVGESEGGVAGGEEVAGEERRRFGLHNDPNVCLSVCAVPVFNSRSTRALKHRMKRQH